MQAKLEQEERILTAKLEQLHDEEIAILHAEWLEDWEASGETGHCDLRKQALQL